MIFGQKRKHKKYDRLLEEPVIKCSICNGEQVAGFRNLSTKAFRDVMLIRGVSDLDAFKQMYGIEDEIKKIY